MSPVEDLHAHHVQVVECSSGLLSGFRGKEVPIVSGEDIVDLAFVNIPAGAFITLFSPDIELTQKIESVQDGAYSTDTSPMHVGFPYRRYVGSRRGEQVLSGVSWRAT